MPHRSPGSDMAPRSPSGHHALNEPSPVVVYPAFHARVRARGHARPAAARADALSPLGRARPALAGDGPRAHQLVAGSVRDSPAAGKEPGPLFRLSLAEPRLPRRRRLGGAATLFL